MTKTQSQIPFDTIATRSTLSIIVFYLAIFFLGKPFIGFTYSSKGEINEVFANNCQPGIEPGNQIETFNAVPWTEFGDGRSGPIFQDVKVGSTITLTILGKGGVITCQVLGWESSEFLERMNSFWWMPVVFWLTGTMTILFIRPRDGLWRALVATNFLIAIWLAAGHVSPTQLAYSSLVLNSVLWLSLAALLDLHWRFPRPVLPLPPISSWLLYGGAGLLAISEWFGFSLIGNPKIPFFVILVSILVLVAVHILTQREERFALMPMAIALGVVLIPVAIVGSTELLGLELPDQAQGMALLGLPAVPGAYFWAIYRWQVGSWQSRINRMFRFYFLLLVALVVGTIIVAWLGINQRGQESSLAIGGLIILFVIGVALAGFLPLLSLAVIAQNYGSMLRPGISFRSNHRAVDALFFVLILVFIALPLTLFLLWFNDIPLSKLLLPLGVSLTFWLMMRYRAGFTRWVENRLLGISVPPAGLIDSYAAHLPTILTYEELKNYLLSNILPSLLIRQSALYYLDELGSPKLLYSQQVAIETLPDTQTIQYQIFETEQLTNVSGLAWVRLALPLKLGNKPTGLWLFGRRDPDDLYAQSEQVLFQSLTNHTAFGLENIAQTYLLRAIYQANISQRDKERSRLARQLHDQVLNNLAAIMLQLDDRSYTPQFEQTYKLISDALRQISHDLRPAMLNHGLYPAFEQLADDLSQRVHGQTEFVINVPAGDTRYPSEVEEHIFYIAQEACRNAIHHAQASQIFIEGQLEPEHIQVRVRDTGRGMNPPSDFSTLLAYKHYGLIGMTERAKTIEATLRIESVIDRGTTIHLDWQATN